MKKRFLIICFLVAWAILTILAVSWGIRYDWPDNVHMEYGLPIVWATFTTSTIVGPVNIWTVDIPSLAMDLSLWLGMMLIGASIMFYILPNYPKEK
jgi:Na+-transporting NADH:ubiquinone oxidoreductase subunit NqrB